MVVDDERTAIRRADRLCCAHFRAQCRLVAVLDAELHQLHAERHEPGDPLGAVDDEVEGVETHEKTALPMMGVEGSAMSRGESRPAWNPFRPASMAVAKAFAITTGSPASATAVLSSTAS